MRDAIPAPIYNDIERHLIEAAGRAVEGWEDNMDDEDALTGDLGRPLRAQWSTPIILNGEEWRWRVRYKKFRGRGRDALEKTIGADGIVQVEVARGESRQSKGLLFQAKKTGSAPGQLSSQVRRMEEHAAGSSAVFEYGPGAYLAASGAEFIVSEARSLRHPGLGAQSLESFLGKSFLSCASGLRGMYYDAVRSLVVLPSGASVLIPIRHRISLEVQGR